MAKHKIAVVLLCGAGFTSLLVLLLNVSVLDMFFSIFLLPGYILADGLVRPKEFSPPLLVVPIGKSIEGV